MTASANTPFPSRSVNDGGLKLTSINDHTARSLLVQYNLLSMCGTNIFWKSTTVLTPEMGLELGLVPVSTGYIDGARSSRVMGENRPVSTDKDFIKG